VGLHRYYQVVVDH
jgi:hypothetical protein